MKNLESIIVDLDKTSVYTKPIRYSGKVKRAGFPESEEIGVMKQGDIISSQEVHAIQEIEDIVFLPSTYGKRYIRALNEAIEFAVKNDEDKKEAKAVEPQIKKQFLTRAWGRVERYFYERKHGK